METETVQPTARPRSREPLSRERIVCVARDFIDRECLADLSMRKLGSELGVEAMSLYRYFPSKAELLDAVIDRVAQGFELPDEDTDWRDAVRGFAQSFRAVGRAHPRIVPLLTSSAAGKTAMRSATEELAASLRRAGFSEEGAAKAECAIVGFVMGATLWTIGSSDAPAPAPEAAPAEDTTQDHFEFGLAVLLAGLEAKLSGQPAISRN